MALLLIMLCVFGQQRGAQQRGKLRRTSLGEDVRSGSGSPTPEVRCTVHCVHITVLTELCFCLHPAGPYKREFAFRNTEVESAQN